MAIPLPVYCWSPFWDYVYRLDNGGPIATAKMTEYIDRLRNMGLDWTPLATGYDGIAAWGASLTRSRGAQVMLKRAPGHDTYSYTPAASLVNWSANIKITEPTKPGFNANNFHDSYNPTLSASSTNVYGFCTNSREAEYTNTISLLKHAVGVVSPEGVMLDTEIWFPGDYVAPPIDQPTWIAGCTRCAGYPGYNTGWEGIRAAFASAIATKVPDAPVHWFNKWNWSALFNKRNQRPGQEPCWYHGTGNVLPMMALYDIWREDGTFTYPGYMNTLLANVPMLGSVPWLSPYKVAYNAWADTPENIYVAPERFYEGVTALMARGAVGFVLYPGPVVEWESWGPSGWHAPFYGAEYEACVWAILEAGVRAVHDYYAVRRQVAPYTRPANSVFYGPPLAVAPEIMAAPQPHIIGATFEDPADLSGDMADAFAGRYIPQESMRR
ncbi:MAG TPA: hypothetical protein VM238_18410 [Phycisphaerae bacterium]|nr:hypothetical protein [Phycisphaerae bacterium]